MTIRLSCDNRRRANFAADGRAFTGAAVWRLAHPLYSVAHACYTTYGGQWHLAATVQVTGRALTTDSLLHTEHEQTHNGAGPSLRIGLTSRCPIARPGSTGEGASG